KGRTGEVQAGSRFPWFSLSQGGVSVSVYQWIREHRKKTFLVIIYNLPDQGYSGLDKELYELISPEVNPANDATLKEAGFPAAFVVLLRPDNYIGYISATGGIGELDEFMKRSYHLENNTAQGK
ncbi:MAG TPA: hypothetical protein VGM41_10745, partial [Chitinophagaceae bacterium]